MKKLHCHLWVTGILLCFLSSCHQPPSRLEAALSLSGANRPELEYVLNHYAKKESDSLHLKSAIFLIENMPGHYELSSSFLMKHRASMDSLYPSMSKIVKDVVYTIPLRMEGLAGPCSQKEDIQTITARYLITHIDNAVSMWQTCPWLKGIPFADFCEYLLPYRVTNEPLLEADSTLHLWKEITRDMDYYNYIPQTMDDIKSFQRSLIGNNDDIYFLNMPAPLLPNKKYTFDCLDICYYDVIGFRLSGVPSAIDFIPN